MISTITVAHTISMGHRLPSYDGICASLHGHNVTFEVTAMSSKFVDFKSVAGKLQKLLTDFDHAMVLWEQDAWLDVFLNAWNRPSKPQFGDPRGELDKAFDALRLVRLSVEPTTEALAQYVFNEMSTIDVTNTKQDYLVTEVIVYETAKYSATCREKDATVYRTA